MGMEGRDDMHIISLPFIKNGQDFYMRINACNTGLARLRRQQLNLTPGKSVGATSHCSLNLCQESYSPRRVSNK